MKEGLLSCPVAGGVKLAEMLSEQVICAVH